MVPRRRSTRSRHHFSCALSLSPGVMRYDTVYEISMTLIIIVAAGTTLRLTQLPCARDTCINQSNSHQTTTPTHSFIHIRKSYWKDGNFFFSHHCQLSPTLTTLVLPSSPVNITLHVSVCFSQNGVPLQFIVFFPLFIYAHSANFFLFEGSGPAQLLDCHARHNWAAPHVDRNGSFTAALSLR